MSGPGHESGNQAESPQGVDRKIHASVEASRSCRFRRERVLREFLFYKREFQADLAEAAVYQAVVMLAFDEESEKTATYLDSLVDVMYLSTDDAHARFTDVERREMYTKADEVGERLLPELSAVLRSSFKRLREYPKDHCFRIAAESLLDIRENYLDHIHAHDMCEVIWHCCWLSASLQLYQCGGASIESCDKSIIALLDVLLRVRGEILDAMESGGSGRA